jgi:hypothetical protein
MTRGLDWANVQLVLGALDLLTDPDQPSTGVDVSPAQAEDFTAAHAIHKQEHERRIERVVGGGLEEGERFGR